MRWKYGINEIICNEPIPYHFNIIRITIIFLIIVTIYLIYATKVMKEKYNNSNKAHKAIINLVVIFFILILSIYSGNIRDTSGMFSKQRRSVYHLYSESLMNGELSLLIEPSEELKNMKNPYDYMKRGMEDVDSLFDIAYYNGQYFVYFTIIPLLLLVIPIKFLTGYYISNWLMMLIFGIIATKFTSLFTKEILTRFFPNIKIRQLVLSTLFMLFTSFLIFNTALSREYELTAVLGYMFVMGGLYFYTKGIRDFAKPNYRVLAIATIFLALAIVARPNLILISLLIVPATIKMFLAKLKEKDKKEIGKLTISILLPYIIIGIFTMWYNYIRFDSILEFGAKYQLTIADMQGLGYRLSTVPMGIVHYLFNPMHIEKTFPFITAEASEFPFVGFYSSVEKGIGLFALNPIMWVIFLLPWLKKELKEKKLWFYTIYTLGIAILMVCAITLVAASFARYSIDFAWMFSIITIVILLFIYEKIKENDFAKKIFKIIVGGLIILSIFTNSFDGITAETQYFKSRNYNKYYKIKSAICFWE